MTDLGIKSQYIPARCIPQILEYYEPHARVHLYYPDKNSKRFVLRNTIETSNPSLLSVAQPSTVLDIHMGFLPQISHYIYIEDTNDLQELNPYNDFRRHESK